MKAPKHSICSRSDFLAMNLFLILYLHLTTQNGMQFKVTFWPYPSGCISTVWGFSQVGRPQSRSRSFSGPSCDLHAKTQHWAAVDFTVYRACRNRHCSDVENMYIWWSQMWKWKVIWTTFDILTHKGWRSERGKWGIRPCFDKSNNVDLNSFLLQSHLSSVFGKIYQLNYHRIQMIFCCPCNSLPFVVVPLTWSVSL